MSDHAADGGIQWDLVREKLPKTAGHLLAAIQQACERDAVDSARAIDRELRSQLAGILQRFEKLKETRA